MANDVIIDQILAQVLMFPETHDQSSFLDENECGTTRCVAGWAVHFSDKYEQRMVEGFTRPQPVRVSDGKEMLWSDAGQDILGLDDKQTFQLFFWLDESQAISFLKDLKNGS